MIIQVERSGGFAGIPLQSVIDISQLDPQERQEMQDLVNSSRFFDTPLPAASSQTAGADRFTYSLTIEEGAKKRTVNLNEADIPENWQPLIQRINLLARRSRGKK
jgi:hypothetical protein